jgi:hypothetical protein
MIPMPASRPAAYQITRTYPPLGGGRLQPLRLKDPASYACRRCLGRFRSRALTVIDNDWLQLACPSCTPILAPLYERDQQTRPARSDDP